MEKFVHVFVGLLVKCLLKPSPLLAHPAEANWVFPSAKQWRWVFLAGRQPCAAWDRWTYGWGPAGFSSPRMVGFKPFTDEALRSASPEAFSIAMTTRRPLLHLEGPGWARPIAWQVHDQRYHKYRLDIIYIIHMFLHPFTIYSQ